MRLLHENISSQSIKSEAQQKALNLLPDVTSRRSRFHYGVLAQMNIRDLRLDPEDKVFIDPEGTKITERMEWYLRKVPIAAPASNLATSYSQLSRVTKSRRNHVYPSLTAKSTAPKTFHRSVLLTLYTAPKSRHQKGQNRVCSVCVVLSATGISL